MKKELLALLDTERERLLADRCTAEEIKSLYEIITKNMNILATAEDIAALTGRSTEAVRNVMSRNYVPEDKKPKRRVFYRLDWFLSVMPKSWRNHK